MLKSLAMSLFKKIKKNSNKVLFSGESEQETVEPESKNQDLNHFENIEKKFKNADEDSENDFQNKVEMLSDENLMFF